jgi:hypothetical protein
MSAPANPADDPPMAEPGKRPTGANVGGIAAAPQAGVADWAQRSSERGDEPAVGRASTGDGAGGTGGPRIDGGGGKAAPGSAPGPSARSERPSSDDRAASAQRAQPVTGGRSPSADEGGRGDDDDEWRHEPVAPVDEPNPLRSLGKAIGDTVTGSDRDTPAPPKR